jgi:hypothetical protein
MVHTILKRLFWFTALHLFNVISFISTHSSLQFNFFLPFLQHEIRKLIKEKKAASNSFNHSLYYADVGVQTIGGNGILLIFKICILSKQCKHTYWYFAPDV